MSQVLTNLLIGGFIFHSAQDGIVAHAGGGAAAAVDIVDEVTRITTVVNPGDSVQLPVAQPGLVLMLINHGANPMQVFGQPNDLINDVNAFTTGVPQMANSVVLYVCTSIGVWHTEGLAQGFISAGGSFATFSTQTGLAAVGTTQGSGPLINAMTAFVATSSVGNTSVSLPSAKPGMEITVVNQGSSQTLLVFPQTGESVNGTLNGSASVANNTITIFYCGIAGAWWTK